MITESVLIDTGPLVALLHRQDTHHATCKDQASLIQGSVLTSWPVVTEAAWLVRRLSGGLQSLLQLLAARDIVCLHLDDASIPWLTAAASRYHDLNPQLADLSLLYLAQQHNIDHIFTLDRRDFLIYRTSKGDAFRLLPESI